MLIYLLLLCLIWRNIQFEDFSSQLSLKSFENILRLNDWWLIDWCIFILLSRESDGALCFRRIRTRLGVDHFPSFPVDVLTSSHVNLLLVRSHQAEIIIVKRLIQGTQQRDPGCGLNSWSCDQSRRKNDAFTHSATLLTFGHPNPPNLGFRKLSFPKNDSFKLFVFQIKLFLLCPCFQPKTKFQKKSFIEQIFSTLKSW